MLYFFFLATNVFPVLSNLQIVYYWVWALNNSFLNTLLLFITFFFLLKKFTKSFFIWLPLTGHFLYQIRLDSWQPISLLVGFNNIHPFFFYTALFMTSYLIINYEKFLYLRLVFLFKIGAGALLLGGYWGVGNSVWGFFWVDDAIEYILLAMCLLVTVYFHVRVRPAWSFYYFLALIYLFGALLSFRWGLHFTRHNFLDNNLINIFSFYLIFFKIKFLIFIYIVKTNIKFLFFFVLLFLVSTQLPLEKLIESRLATIHIILLLLYVSWLRYKPFYFVRECIEADMLSNAIYIYVKQIQSYLYLKIFKSTLKLLALTFTSMYINKLFLFKTMQLSYVFLIFFVSILLSAISTRRFVLDKYKIKSKVDFEFKLYYK